MENHLASIVEISERKITKDFVERNLIREAAHDNMNKECEHEQT